MAAAMGGLLVALYLGHNAVGDGDPHAALVLAAGAAARTDVLDVACLAGIGALGQGVRRLRRERNRRRDGRDGGRLHEAATR